MKIIQIFRKIFHIPEPYKKDKLEEYLLDEMKKWE